MQETWVRSLIWEDPACHGATKPLSHNYWSCAVLSSPTAPTEACMPLSPWSPTGDPLGWEAPTLQRETSPDSLQLEKPHIPVKTHTANNKSIFLKEEKVEAGTDFIFPGSKITAHCDCSHEIKRCLLLSRKTMTNLDSVLQSRDITIPLLTTVRLVKAVVFPVKWSEEVKSLSRVQLFETPWTVARQAPLSMGFSRQEYWSGLP